METRTQQLKTIMRESNLSISQVAEMLGKSAGTVAVWRSKSNRDIPENILQLLKYKIQELVNEK